MPLRKRRQTNLKASFLAAASLTAFAFFSASALFWAAASRALFTFSAFFLAATGQGFFAASAFLGAGLAFPAFLATSFLAGAALTAASPQDRPFFQDVPLA